VAPGGRLVPRALDSPGRWPPGGAKTHPGAYLRSPQRGSRQRGPGPFLGSRLRRTVIKAPAGPNPFEARGGGKREKSAHACDFPADPLPKIFATGPLRPGPVRTISLIPTGFRLGAVPYWRDVFSAQKKPIEEPGHLFCGWPPRRAGRMGRSSFLPLLALPNQPVMMR